MKNFFILLFSLVTSITFAQQIAIWEGGTPGKENCWNEAKNWSNQTVPDEFTFVIIEYRNSGHQAQPIIENAAFAASVEIQSRAKLQIMEKGSLHVDGEGLYTHGIAVYGGQLINKGEIHLNNLDSELSIEDFFGISTRWSNLS